MCQVWIRLDVKSLKVISWWAVPSKKTMGDQQQRRTWHASSPTRKEEVSFGGFMQVFPGFLTTSWNIFVWDFEDVRCHELTPNENIIFFLHINFWRICHNITFWTCWKKSGRKTGVWFSLGGDDFQVPASGRSLRSYLEMRRPSSPKIGLWEMRPRISCSAFVRLICS